MIPTRSQNVPRLARSKTLSLSLDVSTRRSRRRSTSFPPSKQPHFSLSHQMHPPPSSDPEEDPRPLNTDSSDPDTTVLPAHHHSQREFYRRYHALVELLSTELGYLVDLRILVSVYLRLLPVLKNRSTLPLSHPSSSNLTITYFSRAPSFHGHPQPAPLRTHSHLHLNDATYSTTLMQPDDGHLSPPALSNSVPTRAEKSTTRHLFSAADLDAITRNAEDILEFHESLVHRLCQVVSPLGITMTPRGISAENDVRPRGNSPINVHHAIRAISTVFVDHVANFDRYQSFCSGHLEAFDIVRKVQHRYPTEWEAFELRCATLAAEIQLQVVTDDIDSGKPLWDISRRRHSLSSLDALFAENPQVPALSASESGHTDRDTRIRKPQLMFMDYMIKPVQRVCRYPLLFDQLQDRAGPQRLSDSFDRSSPTSKDSQDAVKTALRAMRMVASLVDEARRQQELVAKSARIVSRITQGLFTLAASHSRPSQSALLSSFLSSLGPCFLSGSLDVIHYRGANMARLGTVRAKYLGAFLFPGGFLVLVKVAKSKAYEPKHWFNLRTFELVDSNLDDVLLPSWFRLSSKAHMFEFAASCRREKDIWVDAIRRTMAEEAPWIDEPPSSLQVDLIALIQEDVQIEMVTPLPTIQSIPELDDVESVAASCGELPPAPSRTSHIHRADVPVKDVTTMMESCRRMTHSVSIPESNTFHLVRSTASAREQVDRGLLDVFSEKCLTARFHAHAHEEDLFEAQRVTRSFSRSTSALNMASAMSVAAKNRLTKRESVLVPRKKSFVEGYGTLGDSDVEGYTKFVVSKPTRRRRHPTKLKIIGMTKVTSQERDEAGNEPTIESPSAVSHCSSVSFAPPSTSFTTPAPLPPSSGKADGPRSHTEFLNVRQDDCVPKRSKSMIENVRGLFTPRSASPTIALNREPSTRSSVSNSSLLKWWSRESLRRRVRSAPDVPGGELPSALTIRSLHAEAAAQPILAATNGPYSQPDLHCLYSGTYGSSTSEFGADDPSPPKKGILSSHSRRYRCAASTLSSGRREEDSTPVPARIRRSLSFLHRFTQNTRDCDGIIPP